MIPGISSVQQLAAAHRIVLNGIGEPILITTGRRLGSAVADGAQNIVVMLDADLACRALWVAGWRLADLSGAPTSARPTRCWLPGRWPT